MEVFGCSTDKIMCEFAVWCMTEFGDSTGVTNFNTIMTTCACANGKTLADLQAEANAL